MQQTTLITELMHEAVGHHHAHRFDDALRCYSRVLELQPGNGEAWRLSGVLALQAGDFIAAENLLRRSIRIDPKDAAAYSALGSVCESIDRPESAYAAYAQAAALDASQTAAVIGLARAALTLGRAAEAAQLGARALQAGTVDAGLLRTLGAARLQLREYSSAAEALLASVRLQPHPDAYANLGAACVHLLRVDAAVAACEIALSLDPLHAEAHNNLGIARKAQADFPAALRAFERAAELGWEEAHANLGCLRLLLGDYRHGWPHFGRPTTQRRAHVVPERLAMWDGAPAPGQRLLVWPEQGIGDTIQMVRFLRRARDLVGSITLACPAGTLDLFRPLDGVDAVIEAHVPIEVDAFDLWLPTIRLPVVFAVEPDDIGSAPYLRADRTRAQRFRRRLEAPGNLRIGLVWSGNPEFPWNGVRSCGLDALEALNGVEGVTWFALQQGAARADQPRNGMPLVPINAGVRDFADTAAILAELDLLVSVDTSVAHLAGALGRPGLILLCEQPDWRWQLSGEVSPWYPSLQLFRKRSGGSWAEPVAAVAARVREIVAGG